MVASIAHRQLGNAAPTDFHRTIAEGLFRVVTGKGAGATPDTPWAVIDVSEGYAVMRPYHERHAASAASVVLSLHAKPAWPPWPSAREVRKGPDHRE